MSFVFVHTLPGSERWLKLELARTHAGLKPAYGRPGLVTFKSEDDWTRVSSTFAQASGVSLGAFDRNLVADVGRSPRGIFVFGPGAAAAAIDRAALAGELDVTLAASLHAEDPILDVIVLEDGSRWLGWHPYDPDDLLHPGSTTPIELPAEAPSRAWLKLEEALLYTGAEPAANERALEIGSAPGGAAWSLLKRGLHVIGVDPADMDERVKSHPRFRHETRSINLIPDAELPQKIDWLLIDMNVTPKQTMKVATRVLERAKPKGALLTIKLKDDRSAATVADLKKELGKLGFRRVFARQLPSHKKELLLAALR